MSDRSPKIRRDEFLSEFATHESTLRELRTAAFGIIQTALSRANIEHLPIESRLKDKVSAWQKYLRKNYSDPFGSMTDLLGFRIVVFLESDIDRVAETVRSNFVIDEENSVDKRVPTAVEIVGYRSLHLVCSLGKQRSALPEYKDLEGTRFEIQIRTVLRHAWAEIEHKRNYKGSHTLPRELQHRLMTLAGALELIDREFSQIADEAEKYREKIESGSASAKNEALSAMAIDGALSREFKSRNRTAPSLLESEYQSDLIDELSDFGVATVKQFDDLISNVDLDIISKEYSGKTPNYSAGLIRDIMISSDADRYFESAFKDRWGAMNIRDLHYLKKTSGRSDLAKLMERFGVELFDGPEDY